MKIAIDARIISSSTGRYVERLIHYLEFLDNSNEYFILVRQKDLDFYKPKNPNFKVIEADYANYSFGEQLGLAKLLYRLRVDLVHFCMPQQPLFYLKPTVTTVHDLNLLRITSNDDMGQAELKVKQTIFSFLLKRIAKRSKQIITPTKFVKNDLRQFSGVAEQKVTVTYEGSDVAKDSPKPVPELKGKKFLLYVGRAESYKNNRRLIEAQQKLLKDYPDLHTVIVGKIDVLRQADQKWVEQNNFKNVVFTGFADDSELAWLYQNCAAYVFASTMEGFGLPGLEAMSSGAPVVSSNATCLPEVYGDAAHYFNPLDVDDMVQAISQVLSNNTLRQRLIKNGAQQVKKYSWQKMASQTLEVYNRALQK